MLDQSTNIIQSKEPITLFYGDIHAMEQFEVYQSNNGQKMKLEGFNDCNQKDLYSVGMLQKNIEASQKKIIFEFILDEEGQSKLRTNYENKTSRWLIPQGIELKVQTIIDKSNDDNDMIVHIILTNIKTDQ